MWRRSTACTASSAQIAGAEVDNLYTAEIGANFAEISHVTFEQEDTNLLNPAKQQSKQYTTDWDIFTYQGIVVLENLFNQTIDPLVFGKHLRTGLSEAVK